jgi:CubicO group peptidase (beta-lactamase class C family)
LRLGPGDLHDTPRAPPAAPPFQDRIVFEGETNVRASPCWQQSFIASALLWLLAPAAQAQPGFPANAAVDTIFARFGPATPGCALSVLRAGEVVYARGYGMANLEHDIPITPASVFHVASVSKQFTAMAITMLAQEGRLSLDDDIRKHLPELHDFGATITLRHLLHHTSGMRDQWTLFSLAGWRGQDLKTDADVVLLAARQRDLNFQPGAEHLYSNTGYTLLGQVVKRVTGQSLRDWTTDNLFAPLGMQHTHFHDDYNMLVKNRTHGYAPAAGGYRVSNPAYSTAGATSLFTTVLDMAQWDRNFRDRRVGGGAIDSLHTRGRLNNGQEISYAFALMHGQHRGLRTVGHSGSDAGYRAQYTRYPDQGLSVVVFCNVSNADPGALARRVAEVYLADRFTVAATAAGSPARQNAGATAPQRPVLSADRMQAYAGDYFSAELNTTYSIVFSGEDLIVRRWRFEDQPLRATGEDTFTGPGGAYRFTRGADGRIHGFLLGEGRVRDLRFVRRP